MVFESSIVIDVVSDFESGGLPKIEVIFPVAWGDMDKASSGIFCNKVCFQNRYVKFIALTAQRVSADCADNVNPRSELRLHPMM